MKFRFDREAIERDTVLLIEGDADAVGCSAFGVVAPLSHGLRPGEAVFVTVTLLLVRQSDGDQLSMFAPGWQVRHADDRRGLAIDPEQIEMTCAE